MGEVKLIVSFKGMYLVETPDWNGGKWTDDRAKATRFHENDFFEKYYPQFTVERVKECT